MFSISQHYFIIIVVYIYILFSGFWLVDTFFKKNNFTLLSKISLSAILTCCKLAIVGALIALIPWQFRNIFSIIILCLWLSIGTYKLIHKSKYKELLKITSSESIFLAFGLIHVIICFSLSHLPIHLPDQLPDGAYVNKKNHLGVKIQYLTGSLPADNSIPHVVSEYILRDISFLSNRPILPGQEVTNRPILMALIVVPFRAALSLPPQSTLPLPKFEYVGQQWPDFTLLMEDSNSYSHYLIVAIILNSLIILALGSLHNTYIKSNLSSIYLCILFITSPYFIFQTLFTWPKVFAGFFLIIGALALLNWKNYISAGIFMALAYLSHPYAIVFTISIFLLFGFRFINKKAGLSDFFKYLFSFILTISPWLIWSNLYLKISSDLVSQNFSAGNMNTVDMIWIRLYNLINTIIPNHFHIFPYNAQSIIPSSAMNMTGAMGALIIIPSLIYIVINWGTLKSLVVSFILVPGVLLISIFSAPSLPILHGFQAIVAILMIFGVLLLNTKAPKIIATAVISTQVLVNILMLSDYINTLPK